MSLLLSGQKVGGGRRCKHAKPRPPADCFADTQVPRTPLSTTVVFYVQTSGVGVIIFLIFPFADAVWVVVTVVYFVILKSGVIITMAHCELDAANGVDCFTLPNGMAKETFDI